MRKIQSFFILSFLLSFPINSFAATVLDHFEFTLPDPAIATAGIPIHITITAFNGPTTMNDYFGNVTFTASSGYTTVTPTATDNFSGDPSAWSGNITFYAAGTITLTCTGAGGATGTAQMDVSPGSADRLLVILPGQTHTPGIVMNKGVTPPVQGSDYPNVLEGIFYGVTVLVTDQYYNHVDSFSDTVTADEGGGAVKYSPDNVEFLPTGIGYFTMQTKYGSESGDLTTIKMTSASGLTEFNGGVDSFSSNSGFLHLQVPQVITAGEYFSITATVSASFDNPNAIMNNISDNFEFIEYYVSNSQQLPADPDDRDNLDEFVTMNGYLNTANHEYYFNEAGPIDTSYIYLQAPKIGGPSGIPILPVTSNTIKVLPNVPHNMQISVAPSEVQSNHKAIITATVYDEYGNTTRSGLYPFAVTFSKTSTNGYLSTSITAADDNGVAQVDYTAGTTNEEVVIDVAVINNITLAEYCSQSVPVKVSVAPVSPGSIVNYPNPFNPATGQTTSINYYLEEAGDVEIRIYNPFGRLVFGKDFKKDDSDVESLSATQQGGAAWEWDGKNGEGKIVANGIYFVKIKARTPGKTQEYKRRVGVIK